MIDFGYWLTLAIAGLLLLVLLEVRRAERALRSQAAAIRVGNDLAARAAANEQARRLAQVRSDFGQRHHGHGHGHGHHGGNASIQGGCE